MITAGNPIGSQVTTACVRGPMVLLFSRIFRRARLAAGLLANATMQCLRPQMPAVGLV
jgi:hypothetical protein